MRSLTKVTFEATWLLVGPVLRKLFYASPRCWQDHTSRALNKIPLVPSLFISSWASVWETLYSLILRTFTNDISPERVDHCSPQSAVEKLETLALQPPHGLELVETMKGAKRLSWTSLTRQTH